MNLFVMEAEELPGKAECGVTNANTAMKSLIVDGIAMSNLETLLQNLETARNRCVKIPFKQFPMTVIIENNAEQTEMINSYINLGLRVHTKLLQLIEITRVQKEALDKLKYNPKDLPICACHTVVDNTIAKVEEIASEK